MGCAKAWPQIYRIIHYDAVPYIGLELLRCRRVRQASELPEYSMSLVAGQGHSGRETPRWRWAVAWRIGTLARQPAGLPLGGVLDRIRGVFDWSVGQQQLIIT